MAALYLIRHGQATFGQADYDLLSEKGMQQAHVLGRVWQRQPTPTHCYLGDLLRHEQTKQHFFLGLGEHQPQTICHSGFNEFDHQDILIKYKPRWHRYADMQADLSKEVDAKQALITAFDQAVLRWMSGEFDDDYKETWSKFKARCIQALNDVIEQQLSARSATEKTQQEILVFTSGGPISVILGHVLGLDLERGMALNQQLRNTSVTKLLFSDNRLSVDFYNNYSHLTQVGDHLESYR